MSGNSNWPRACVQVYTGPGKGKTTAALGLTLRALGAGLRVWFGQFIKRGHYSELKALERFGDQVRVCQFGSGRFITELPSPDDRRRAAEGIAAATAALTSGDYHLVVLDEVCGALAVGVLDVDQVLGLLDRRPAEVELLLTGRDCPEPVLARADLVTRMDEVRHYFAAGVPARTGIEK